MMAGRRIDSLDLLIQSGLFDDYRESMFRLETLQAYDVSYEAESYARFIAGEPVDQTPGPWAQRISKHRDAGRLVQRVHVVTEPIGDYLRYEIEVYRRNAGAGEDIRLLPTAPGHWPEGVPTYDYLLFDDARLWIMEYDQVGDFIAAYEQLDSAAVDSAVAGKRAALAAAMPLESFLARRRDLRRVS